MKINAQKELLKFDSVISVNEFSENENLSKVSLATENVKSVVGENKLSLSGASKKYKNESNVFVAIETQFKEDSDEFIADENVFHTRISKELYGSSGVSFGDETHELKLFPVSGSTKPVLAKKVQANRINFANFSGKDTISFFLDEEGLNQEISISELREEIAYSFRMELSNLTAQVVGGVVEFRDSETDLVIFKLNSMFAYDKNKKQTSAITMSVDDKDGVIFLSFSVNKKWIAEIGREFPIQISTKMVTSTEPLIRLTSYRNKGTATQIIDNKMILGVKDGVEYSIKATIQAIKIVSELIANRFSKYKVLLRLNFEDGVRATDSKGIQVYSGSVLLATNLLSSKEEGIVVDITKLIDTQMNNYRHDRAVNPITLTFLYRNSFVGSSDSNGYSTSRKVTNDYVFVFDRLFDEEGLRPDFELEYSTRGEVIPGTPFLEYETNKAGKSKINLTDLSLAHSFPLGAISDDALGIDIALNYDSRFKEEQTKEKLKNNFGKGWFLNVCQRLIKGKDYNKVLGSKDVVYVDGENNRHYLSEKWYYEDEGIRHYVEKEDVFIDNDQKLKYDDGTKIHIVEYEATNDEGLRLVSTNSKMNYIKKSDMKAKREYFITLANNVRKVIPMNSKGMLSLPLFYRKDLTWEDIKGKSTTGNELLLNSMGALEQFKIRKFIPYSSVKQDGFKYFDLNGNELYCESVYKPLYFKDGNYCAITAKNKYLIKMEGETENYCFSEETSTVKIEVEKKLFVDRDTPVVDYYENEDITNINSQIEQAKDYIENLKVQCQGISNGISRLETEINRQVLTNSATIQINKDTEQNGSNSDRVGRNNASYQKKSMESQLAEQQESLKDTIEKLHKSEMNLANLQEAKADLVRKQKEGVQDYVMDTEGNVFGFDYYGKLVYVTDSYENEIHIVYENGRIIQIATEKRAMILHYDDNELLDYFIDTEGRRKNFCYDSDVLVSINYVAERNAKQSIVFAYDDEKLSLVKDSSGLKTVFKYQSGILSEVLRLTGTSLITTEDKFLLNEDKILSDETIKKIPHGIMVKDMMKNNETSHYFDDKGRLILSKVKDLDTNETSMSFVHFKKALKLFEASYTEKETNLDLIHTFGSKLGYKKEIVETVDLAPIADKLPVDGFTFVSIDMTKVSDEELKLNDISLKAVVIHDDGEKEAFTQTFSRIYPSVIGLPIVLRKTDRHLTIYIESTKEINFSCVENVRLYKATGRIDFYNNDEDLIKSVSGLSQVEYSKFENHQPTIIKETDEHGEIHFTYRSYDAQGRTVFEEDSAHNCIEQFFDEKGNVIQKREYNKECPTLVKVSKYEYDDQGNVTEIDGIMRDENGDYPQKKITYLPGTSKISTAKDASGQTMCYGYDFHTDDILEISSDAAGQGNNTRMKYHFGLLTSLTHHGFSIEYELDGQGRKSAIIVGGKKIVEYQYVDNLETEEFLHGTKVISKMIDGNSSEIIKDKKDRTVRVSNSENEIVDCQYADERFESEATRVVMHRNDEKVEELTTEYNDKGQIVSQVLENQNGAVSVTNKYGTKDLLMTSEFDVNGTKKVVTYNYDFAHDDRIIETTNNDISLKLDYDALSRVTNKKLVLVKGTGSKVLLEDEFEYLQDGENTLDLIKEHNIKLAGKLLDTVSYTYDVAGNITTVIRDEFKTRYTYDKLNRLIREDDPILSKTFTYRYDNGGNMIMKKEYAYTLEKELLGGKAIHYTYSSEGWRDQMTSYEREVDGVIQTIDIGYDNLGRPIQIGDDTLEWNAKNQLVSLGDNKFTYNMEGIRIGKKDSDGEHKYFLIGKKIIKETIDDKEIIFDYAMEKVVGFKYNGARYIYERNIQGDVLRIYESDTSKPVAEYLYDGWGNHKVINLTEDNIGDINPIRYRGYYYDKQTNLYYLNSRYYSPELHRFISPDTLAILDETKAQINGLNLYMYCKDNPIMFADENGMFGILCTLLFLGAIGAATSLVSQGVSDVINGNEFNIGNYLIAAGAGFIGGLCYAIPVPGLNSFVAGAVTSGLTTAGQMAISGEKYNVWDYVIKAGGSALVSGLSGLAFGGLTSGLSYFSDTSFFLDNFILFATNYGGITLERSVVSQLAGQLIGRGIVTGVIGNLFGSLFDGIVEFADNYYNLRKMGMNPWESFKYSL